MRTTITEEKGHRHLWSWTIRHGTHLGAKASIEGDGRLRIDLWQIPACHVHALPQGDRPDASVWIPLNTAVIALHDAIDIACAAHHRSAIRTSLDEASISPDEHALVLERAIATARAIVQHLACAPSKEAAE